jgi:hypothetical protein
MENPFLKLVDEFSEENDKYMPDGGLRKVSTYGESNFIYMLKKGIDKYEDKNSYRNKKITLENRYSLVAINATYPEKLLTINYDMNTFEKKGGLENLNFTLSDRPFENPELMCQQLLIAIEETMHGTRLFTSDTFVFGALFGEFFSDKISMNPLQYLQEMKNEDAKEKLQKFMSSMLKVVVTYLSNPD